MSELYIGDASIRPITDIADQQWASSLLLPESTPELFADPLDAPPETFARESSALRMSFGGHLIVADSKRILVDCGVGVDKTRSPRSGWSLRTDRAFESALARAGCRPADIDIVIITHAHSDHVGWLTIRSDDQRGWQPTFPNAEHIFAAAELEHWLDKCSADPTIEDGAITDSVLPVVSEGLVRTIAHEAEVATGVTIRAYPGHTPGSTAVWVESEGQSAIICGDIIHHPIQLRYPDLSSAFCVDPREATRSRRRLLDEAVRRHALLLPSHFRTPPTEIEHSSGHYAMSPPGGSSIVGPVARHWT